MQAQQDIAMQGLLATRLSSLPWRQTAAALGNPAQLCCRVQRLQCASHMLPLAIRPLSAPPQRCNAHLFSQLRGNWPADLQQPARAFVRLSPRGLQHSEADSQRQQPPMQGSREQYSLLRTTSEQWDQATKTASRWPERAVANLRESLLLTYTTLVESVLVSVADVLRLTTFLNWLTPRLERGAGTLTGKYDCCQGLLICYS